MSVYVLAILSIAGGLVTAAIGDMVSDEVRDRLDHLPHAILRLAVYHLDAGERAAIYDDEWLPELTYILRGDEARPVSRLYHGARFALGILMTARRISQHLHREAPSRWQAYPGILPPWAAEMFLALEATASLIREYELQFIPDLLQIEEYARALIPLSNLPSEEEVNRITETRISRREILSSKNPPRLWAVIDEAALRRPIGGPEVMRAQLRHLIDMCDHPAVTLQILPFSASVQRATSAPFRIFRYSDTDLPDVVYIEQLTRAMYIDKPAEVNSYTHAMEWIVVMADPPKRTKAILQAYLAAW